MCDLELWPHPWHWPWSFNIKVWNRLVSGMEGLIGIIRKRWDSSIHDRDLDPCVITEGWVDVRDSDWGDFRRRRAVDISSSYSEYEISFHIFADMPDCQVIIITVIDININSAGIVLTHPFLLKINWAIIACLIGLWFIACQHQVTTSTNIVRNVSISLAVQFQFEMHGILL